MGSVHYRSLCQNLEQQFISKFSLKSCELKNKGRCFSSYTGELSFAI